MNNPKPKKNPFIHFRRDLKNRSGEDVRNGDAMEAEHETPTTVLWRPFEEEVLTDEIDHLILGSRDCT